jgi:hypothetical protein
MDHVKLHFVVLYYDSEFAPARSVPPLPRDHTRLTDGGRLEKIPVGCQDRGAQLG